MYASGPAFTELVRRTVLRIQAMAPIHRKLHISQNLSRIELGECLRELARSIDAYSSGLSRGIELRVEIEKAEVSIDTAIPCGLVVNELLVNAYKHAFKGREKCEIRRSSTRQASGEFRMLVADDGIGSAEETEATRRLGSRQ